MSDDPLKFVLPPEAEQQKRIALVRAQFKLPTCNHPLIFVDEESRALQCNECKQFVDPFWIILRNMKYEERLSKLKSELDKERKSMEEFYAERASHIRKQEELRRVNSYERLRNAGVVVTEHYDGNRYYGASFKYPDGWQGLRHAEQLRRAGASS